MESEMLDSYFEHEQEILMKSKTKSALREKHKAPSSRQQIFEILRGKGLYKKLPAKQLKDFKDWLQSPSGGQLKCPDEIVSEIWDGPRWLESKD